MLGTWGGERLRRKGGFRFGYESRRWLPLGGAINAGNVERMQAAGSLGVKEPAFFYIFAGRLGGVGWPVASCRGEHRPIFSKAWALGGVGWQVASCRGGWGGVGGKVGGVSVGVGRWVVRVTGVGGRLGSLERFPEPRLANEADVVARQQRAGRGQWRLFLDS